MKKVIGIILAIITIVSCVFAFTACSNKGRTVEEIKESGQLVVATNAYFPPFEYKDETGKITGWDMDIAAALAEKLGVELVISDMEFDSVLLAPNVGKADIAMAGISYSAKRDETLDFTVGVFNSSQVIIVKEGSSINGPFDLGGKKVGVQTGTVGNLLANMDPEWAGEGEDACLAAPGSVSTFSTGAEAVMALKQDKVDAVIIDKFPAENYVKNNAGIKIAAETVFDDEYAFAVKEGSKELVKWLNEAIAEMKADGTMDAINAKYFG